MNANRKSHLLGPLLVLIAALWPSLAGAQTNPSEDVSYQPDVGIYLVVSAGKNSAGAGATVTSWTDPGEDPTPTLNSVIVEDARSPFNAPGRLDQFFPDQELSKLDPDHVSVVGLTLGSLYERNLFVQILHDAHGGPETADEVWLFLRMRDGEYRQVFHADYPSLVKEKGKPSDWTSYGDDVKTRRRHTVMETHYDAGHTADPNLKNRSKVVFGPFRMWDAYKQHVAARKDLYSDAQ